MFCNALVVVALGLCALAIYLLYWWVDIGFIINFGGKLKQIEVIYDFPLLYLRI
jgi:hypothetical protein